MEKEIDYLYDTITEKILYSIQELGYWGEEKVPVSIYENIGDNLLVIDCTVLCDYDIKTGMKGDFWTPDDPDEYTLTYAYVECDETNIIRVYDPEENILYELKNWCTYERITR